MLTWLFTSHFHLTVYVQLLFLSGRPDSELYLKKAPSSNCLVASLTFSFYPETLIHIHVFS